MTQESHSNLKRCFRCGEEKLRTEYYAHPMMGDGLLGKCKPCTRAGVRSNYEQNRDRYRLYDQRRAKRPDRVRARRVYAHTPEGRASRARTQRRQRQRHPERAMARNAVSNALRDGRLIRLPCAECGHPKTDAHHHDYMRPLDVLWLCRPHHVDHEGRRNPF